MANAITIFCDGGSRGNPGPAASAFVAFDDKGHELHRGSKYLGKTTNNVAEYQAVLMALRWLLRKEKNTSRVTFIIDSDLVAKQINGVYKIKSENLKPLVVKAKTLQKKFPGRMMFTWSPRGRNKLADRLVNEKLDEKE